ncbi:MAG: hypothetical protein ABI690_25555 [Chloroflexota bacterium]
MLQHFGGQASGKIAHTSGWVSGMLVDPMFPLSQWYIYPLSRNILIQGIANALAAYAEGLRGDALIEALGGILDG